MKFQEKLSLSAASAIWSLLTVIIKLMEYCKIKCNAKIHAISKYKNKSFLTGKKAKHGCQNSVATVTSMLTYLSQHL